MAAAETNPPKTDVGRPLLSDEMLLSKEAVELKRKLLSEERVRSC